MRERFVAGDYRDGRDLRRREAAPQRRKDNKRGRGTRKPSVVGAVQRRGEVKAQVTRDTKGRTLLGFIKAIC